MLVGTCLAVLIAGSAVRADKAEENLSSDAALKLLYDFNGPAVPTDISTDNAAVTLVRQGGSQALRVALAAAHNASASLSLIPPQPWQWIGYRDFHVAFDIANPGTVSVQLYLDIEDIDGGVYTRTVSVPVGAAKTYYAKLAGHDLRAPDDASRVELNFASGLRGNPYTWQSDDVQFVSLWGPKNLNLNGIRRMTFGVRGALRDKVFTLDNVRLRPNPPQHGSFLHGIVDEYGQNASEEFPGKIHTNAELIAQRDAEARQLAATPALPERSRFGGWTKGPRLEASGYFRTQKLDGRWHLVDPDGHLYFATGLDIIRLSNSTTMTGYDFDPKQVEQRSSDDVTPEDSMGLNTVPREALDSRRLVSPLRAGMFTWLPDYDAELGNHFGYRREAHSGPLSRGETFSFYSANLERKYGESAPQSYLDNWERNTIDRMLSWGFTSLGNWTDPRFYDQQRIPFFANGWIIGDFKTVSSGDDFWAPLPDVFDPIFAERARATVAAVAADVAGTPWCVGVFIDNEKSFGRPETDASRLGLVLHTLRRDGAEVPTKRAFTQAMRDHYETIEALNEAWGADLDDWQTFDRGIDSTLRTAAQVDDYASLLHLYAKKYFSTVQSAMREYMPDHLYLGSRFPDWGMPPEVVSAAAQHVDVLSFNSYKEGLPEHTWAFLADVDMPAVIGEFHIGSSDSGLFHPGLIHAADQADRARMYSEYMHSVIDNPYFVGAHWFQYVDSPLTGRAYDGENYNVGFVSVADVPYRSMVDAARKLHRDMYVRRAGSR